MADEQKLTKIQQVLGENTEKTEAKIKAIEAELENERRKSMADERKVKELEKVLNEKVYFLNELTKRKSEGEK
jgi:hypothetical protein